ncbi:MAG: lysophospholipase [Syntrophales bacterium]|jgi:alpha-beta hydrolase superfamily lysophospholipase|nr:lysophospholipase [Syntrophales bacterium]
MVYDEGFFKYTGNDNIFYRSCFPEEEPLAIILIVHGLAEHCGRYSNVIDYFTPRGYAFYGFDLPGHGKSSGTRAHLNRFADYTNALQSCHSMIKKHHYHLPLFLLGHSMGGLIAARYLIDHQEELTGAVLSAPSIKVPENISPVTIFAGRILSFLVPSAGILTIDAEGVSRDPKVVTNYIQDPFVFRGKATARLSAELLDTMQYVMEAAAKITLPILVIQGSADKLVDPEGAKIFYNKAGSSDKKIIIYEGLYHEVLNEPEHGRVLEDLETWLSSHIRLIERGG